MTTSNVIVRTVTVNRQRTAQEMLDATAMSTGRRLVVARPAGAVETMPRGEGEKVRVYFFLLEHSERFSQGYQNGAANSISDKNLEIEYELHGLKPADPYSLAAVNEADPAFADKYHCATHWHVEPQNLCGLGPFCEWDALTFGASCTGERGRAVNVMHSHSWFNGWWLAGVEK